MSGALCVMLGTVDFTVSVPETVSNTRSTPIVTSSLVSATVLNGSGSYSHLWIWQNGDDIEALSPNASSTQFQARLVPDQVKEAVFIDRVTDIVTGLVKDSNQITVTLAREPI